MSSKDRGIVDLEAGNNGELYPMMMEPPEVRWAFIRKVYAIVFIQLFLTAIVAAIVGFVRSISRYLVSTTPGLAIYILVLISPFIIMCPLFAYRQRHPLNFILLALFTVALAFSVGMSCAFVKGKVILEAVILTCVIVVSLTLYTFWGAKRGQDFSFLGPFLFAGLMVLLVFVFIQIFVPLGKLSVMIFGFLAAIIFCGFIVYDTDNLIKRYSYDEYIAASVSLYIDIINLFLALLTIFNAADN